jgi:hypothetical protein
MDTRELNSIEDARFTLGGISRATIYELLNNGELSSVVIGRRRFAPAAAIAACGDLEHDDRAVSGESHRPSLSRANAPAARAGNASAGPAPHCRSALRSRSCATA